jgi:two-component system cell cycle response regulator
MPGRVLIVDDVATNRLLLKNRLSNAYYDVIEAADGLETLDKARSMEPDIILLDVMMPGIDGFETCRRLKSDLRTLHIPVVMLTALDKLDDRVEGLEAGADDFLSKPFEDLALMSRVASLTRTKMLVDELSLRGQSASAPADQTMIDIARAKTFEGSSVLIVSQDAGAVGLLGEQLRQALKCKTEIATSVDDAQALIEFLGFDAVIIGETLDTGDPLRFGSMVRARPETRQAATLLMLENNDLDLATRALELGFSDYIACPVDTVELIARMRSMLRRKHYADQLRHRMRLTMVEAVTDPLTGTYNRRYASNHLDRLIERARLNQTDLAVMMLDIDRFKRINDTFGHAIGDLVLQEFVSRLASNVREMDLVSRMGGEEFMVIMPEIESGLVAEIAERVRAATEAPEFHVDTTDETLPVTVSIGYAVLQAEEGPEGLIDRADQALYKSKNEGRNRVTLANAA